ncbi:MAG TPA: hypothetical protein VFZ09_41820 [Archangium sp.]|uniref:hypothetical protein n=1 Tax=Archangium sp. TaxID=1872627 RepID=UPI002E30A1BC|nr:hypothetical protein [Archangium sp.]HEX5752817.1 hypothetical protein [Archangium sp.]
MKTTRKNPLPLWLLGVRVWAGAFLALSVLEYYQSTHQQGHSGRIEWRAVALLAGAVAGLVVMIVERIRAEPTPEERAVFWAIFHSPPGTIGAVVVTRNGKPEVIATVRSTEEYLKLAGSGQLPPDHRVFLPEDIV